MAEQTVYLVDDYLLTRISNKKQLENSSFYKIAGDFRYGSDCMAALVDIQPDFILTDVDLPDISGIEFCKIIKEKYPKVKIIILTSQEDSYKALILLSCGVSAYALKGENDIEHVLNVVSQGGIWLDSELAMRVFSKIPLPDIKNSENLNRHEELKYSLTKRELDVLKLMIEGKTNSQIAQEIFVSTNTIKAHVGNILEKFGATDRVQASVMAVRANIF